MKFLQILFGRVTGFLITVCNPGKICKSSIDAVVKCTMFLLGSILIVN